MAKIAKPRRHGNRWRINFTDAHGARRWESYRTHKEATESLRHRQAEADAMRSGRVAVIDQSKSFAELVALWKEVKHRKRTLKDDDSRIRNHLLPAFGQLKLADIDASRIARLERHMSRSVKTGTVRQVLSLLRSMLRLAVQHRWLGAAPAIKLPVVDAVDYTWLRTEDEIRALLQAAQETDYPGLMEFYATALYTGLRAGELCGLLWSDVDVQRRLITVQHSFHEPTKTNEVRRVPILDVLLPLLRDWKLRCPDAELVFPNLQGKMHVSGARVTRQTFHRCLERAGIGRIRFHDLRHTFASHWMLNGNTTAPVAQMDRATAF